jgi:sec-independent protein translocase protein TatB
MPSFPDSIFLFVLALLLFGPKRLPVLARELGKWVGEFRRASNEFKMQMEDELRQSEQAERNKQLAAIEAAAPVAPAIAETAGVDGVATETAGTESTTAETSSVETQVRESGHGAPGVAGDEVTVGTEYEVVDGVKTVVPIAVSGELKIMPPSTGLPVAAASGGPGGSPRNSALKGLLDAIPAAVPAETPNESAETAAHGN